MIRIIAKTQTIDNTIPAVHMSSGKAKDVFISTDSVIDYAISPADMKGEVYDTAIITGGELYIIRSIDMRRGSLELSFYKHDGKCTTKCPFDSGVAYIGNTGCEDQCLHNVHTNHKAKVVTCSFKK